MISLHVVFLLCLGYVVGVLSQWLAEEEKGIWIIHGMVIILLVTTITKLVMRGW